MVRKILLLTFLFLFPLRVFAAEFMATVDSNDVTAGEGFSLQLTLSGTEPQGDPDTSAIERYFTIAGEGQTSSTTIINGAVSSNVGWSLNLLPKKPGHLTIPPVTIQTKDGILSTQPINIQVGRAAATVQGAPPQDGSRGVSVAAYVDTDEPYQNQAIHYSVKVVTQATVSDLMLDDLVIDGSVIDKTDQPKVSVENQNGRQVRVIEFNYVITPLQPGRMAIPAPVLHGNIASAMQRFPNPSDQDFSNPFVLMQALSGMGMMQPFSTSGNEIDLDVKPPAAAMTPWLPLYSLQIKDDWKGLENAKAGEPLSREVMILADGTTGSQLPSLEDKQNHADFKVYADKATSGDDKGGEGQRISAWRKENYTLIPKKDGKLVIPAIKVPWWDITRNAVAYAELPERIIDVAPGAVTSVVPPPANTSEPLRQPAATAATQGDLPLVLYAIIGLLLSVLLMIGIWSYRLQRRVSAIANKDERKEIDEKPTPAVDAQALDRISTPEELKNYIQAYAAQHWGAPANASLAKIPAAAPSSVRKDAAIVVKALTAALYGQAGRPIWRC